MNYGDYGHSYSTTAYGAGGEAGGGGFFEGSQGGSQGSPSGGREKKNTLRPVTIKQVLEAQPTPDGEHFKIGDQDLTHITLVAQILNISDQSTFITYKVDDGTGNLDIKQWVDPDAQDEGHEDTSDLPSHLQPSNKPKLVENMYVRILGQLKMLKNKRLVSAHSIRLITDPNEVLYHILECVAIHLYYTRGPPEQFHPGGLDNLGVGRDVEMSGTADNSAAAAAGTKSSAKQRNVASWMARSDISVTAKKILSLLVGATGDEGLHINVIQQRLQIPMNEVLATRDKMFELGAAFPTVDDYHMSLL